MKKLLSIFTLITLIFTCVLLVACTNGNESETTAADTTVAETEADVTSADTTVADTQAETEAETEPQTAGIKVDTVTVYCPDTAYAWERNAAKKLAAELIAEYGIDVTLSAEHNEREILIGRDTLGEYKEADYSKIGCNGYKISTKDDKIILTATMDVGIEKAVAKFVSDAVTSEGEYKVVSRSYTASEDEKIERVQADAGKHLDVELSSDLGYDVYLVPASLSSGYRYGPSIIVNEDGTMDAWFATSGSGGKQWDWISWRHSDDGKTWSEEKIVLQPTPNGLDHYSCCDPGVIYFNGYYYLGYTSTVNANQKDNCIFVARSENPDGPFEKWNGTGWGGNEPYPIVYFEENTEIWGSGEPSFVELDGTLYIYYTWAGTNGHITYVSTADATDDNWPATMVRRGIAVTKGNNDSIDVKYVEEFGKFIAIGTDSRMTASSYLVFFESNDGITFTTTDICKKYVAWYCHNSGIAGNARGHITANQKKMVGYAYGEGWGIWNTRFQDITIMLSDTVDLSEKNGSNTHLDSARDTRNANDLEIVGITCREDDVYYVSATKNSFNIKIYYYNCYHNYWKEVFKTEESGLVKYSGYDPNVVECTDGSKAIKVKGEGSTVVTVEWKGFITSFAVCVSKEYKDATTVVAVEPLVMSEYVIDTLTTDKHVPQIKAKITYANLSWSEGFGGNGITYSEYDESIIKINSIGQVQGLKAGKTTVTLTAGDKTCTVSVTVLGEEEKVDYANISFKNGVPSGYIGDTNGSDTKLEGGAMLVTPTELDDPFITLDYSLGSIKLQNYKSITIKYKLPSGVTSTKGQLFFYKSGDTQWSESSATKFDMTADGEWHEVTINLAGAYASGELQKIRYDFFDHCNAGEKIYLESIVFNKK